MQTWTCLHCVTFSATTMIKRWWSILVSVIFFGFQNCECNLQATIWGDAAKDSYSPKDVPAYVTNILGPMRKYYVNEKRAGKELLVSNIEVSSRISCIYMIKKQDCLLRYLFSGKIWWIQCIWERLCNHKHLLWWRYSHGQVQIEAFKVLINILAFTEYERALKMTSLDFISSFGGVCGLFLGFSLLSFVEIIYWFIVVLARRIIFRG